MSFFAELKRRNVIRVAVLYVVAAWLLLQVADVGMSVLDLPTWTGKLVFLLLALGFPIALIFSWIYELTPEGIKRESLVNRSASIAPETGRRLNFVTGILVVAAAGVLVADRLLPEDSGDTPRTADTTDAVPQQPAGDAAGGPGTEAEAEAPAQSRSVAVLPFVNMSGDPDNEYFADGLTEELLNALAKLEGLKVAARTSSFRFKGEAGDIAEIGRQLGVANILEGSVRKAGNQIRVTAQLIQVEDGFHLWSETYDRQLEDIFSIQDDIAGNVAAELKATLFGETVAPEQSLVGRPTQDLEAYTAYLRGREQLAINSYDSFDRAEAFFREAIERDPSFAEAHASLGHTFARKSEWGALSRADAVPLVRQEADRALALNGRLPLAWAVKAWAAQTASYDAAPSEADRLRQDARRFLRKALEIEPGNTQATLMLSSFLLFDDPSGALELARSAVERDPASSRVRGHLSSAYAALGMLEEAERQARIAFELEPEDPLAGSRLASMYEESGRLARAIRVEAAAYDRRDPEGPAQIAMQYLALGDLEAADAWIREAERLDKEMARVRAARALHLWLSGSKDQAADVARRVLQAEQRGYSGPVTGVIVRERGLETGDLSLAMQAFESDRKLLLDPAADLDHRDLVFDRAMALAILQARGEEKTARELGEGILAWLGQVPPPLPSGYAEPLRALVLQGMRDVEGFRAAFTDWKARGISAWARIIVLFPAAWGEMADHPDLVALREQERAWADSQRRELAASG
ncbi:MAG: hypothetical protein P8080_02575, partial [Gammaproteobacteria bacterium]